MKTFAHDPFVKIAHKSFCVVNMPVWALDWSSGTNASFNGTDTVTVDALRSIGVWNNFDTAPGELIQFLQNGGGALTANHAVLNKVIGADPTLFEGLLRGGQGHIILFNPNGITIGGTAVIDAGRFTATTMGLTMTDDEFIAGNSDFEFAKGSDDPAAQISLLAGSEISAQRVDLLAQKITNAGMITTGPEGVVAMVAGDRVLLGESGSNIIVEMLGSDGGMVTNSGIVNAPEGTIVMAAGDIYATPTIGMKVFDGAGMVTQDGILNTNAATVDGSGGTIHLLAGENITLTENSLTTANAAPDGIDPTDRPYGGDIIIEATEAVFINPGATLSAKGNGWYDVDENFRFDFGVDTSFSGSIKIAGKYLNLAAPEIFATQIDLIGYEGGQIQSGVLTIGNNEGDMIVAEGPLPGMSAANTVYEEWIEGMSLAEIHIDTLSAGDITFNDLNPGDNKDLGLIGGNGNISFRTQFDTGGIFMDDLTDIIGTLDGGDIFMVAGSGGITTGAIGITNEDRTGDPGQIILATANGGDIQTGLLAVRSGNHEIVSISSSGDVTIDGGVDVYAQEVSDAADKTVTADICIDAGDDITIIGSIEAEAHGKVEMITNIHIDAGLDPESNDAGESQAGIITIDLDGGQISAKSEASGPDPEGTNDLYSEATIEIHTSATGEEAINITNGKAGGSQAIQVRANVQGGLGFDEAMPFADPTNYSESDSDFDNKGNMRTANVQVEIQSGYDVSQCDDCVPPPFLPPTPKFFLIKNDEATIDWRAGYTIIGDQMYDPAELDILLNDNGPGVPLFEADIIAPDGGAIVLETEKGGTLTWTTFTYDYIDENNNPQTAIYDGFLYTPPSYTEDFEWDGVSDYATFTDSFQYRARIGEGENADISLNIATVTLTVQNEVPTLAGDSDTIHMNTSSSFDLSTLVTDADGTPGELTGDSTGTYGSLNYQIVEGQIPVPNGTLGTDGTLSLTDQTITYTPLDGYVSPNNEATTFGYTVTDDNISGAVFELPEDENLNVTVTNTLPTFSGDLGDVHMNTIVEGIDLLDPAYAFDADGDPLYVIVNGQIATVSDFIEGNNITAAELEYQGSNSWTYTPADGYTGGESFTVTLWDGQYDYTGGVKGDRVSNDGLLTVNMTNDLPTFSGNLGDVHMNTIVEGIDLLTYANDINGDTLYVLINGEPVALNDFINGNNIDASEIKYDGTNWTYTPTDGYVGPEAFTVVVWDGEFDYSGGVKGDKVTGSGLLTVNMTNSLPGGAVILEDASMDAVNEELDVVSGDFTDPDSDAFAITNITPATDDENLGFGGDLDYNGSKEPYVTGDSYNYSADPLLPGYVGEDDFDVQLWDGQYDYVKITEGSAPEGYEFFSEGDGYTIYRTKVYGSGTIDLELVNELPGGNAYFGQVHMDSQGVTQGLEVDFDSSITVIADTYTGSVIGSDNYGGTLVFDGTTWTYSTDTGLPGYVGDDNDEFGQPGYVADDLFAVNINSDLGQQYDYWFSDDTAPEGYTFYEPAGLYRKAESGGATVSVDITNLLPTIDENTTIEHMNEDILNQLFASDQLDSNPIVELDALTALDGSGNPTVTYTTDFGINVTITQNPDGSLAYTYDPAEGYVGQDSFDVMVWDGQVNYVFTDGEIDTEASTQEVVNGVVSLEYTNILPSGTGDLGSTESGTTLIVGQTDTTSPVLVIDIPDLPQQTIPDTLSIPDGTYTGNAGGTLVFDGTDWIYTPAPGFEGQETFTIDVWDGQNAYGSHIEGGIQGPVYGQGTVTVTVSELPPPPPTPTPTPTPVLELAPVAPLADYEIPRLVGCPAEMEAAANELATNSDQLQLLIANAMATNPNLQPCDACANLLTAATVLKQMDN
ncbi:MAG: Ig-like domain-containing protein, partial [Planctomycetota bacterium]